MGNIISHMIFYNYESQIIKANCNHIDTIDFQELKCLCGTFVPDRTGEFCSLCEHNINEHCDVV